MEVNYTILKIDQQVTFTGNLPRNEALNYIYQADVCLSPFVPIPILKSTSPTKLCEYLLFGKPTIANYHPEQLSILNDSKGGFCVPYKEEAFSHAIITLLKNENLAKKMGELGKKYILKEREYTKISKIVENAYFNKIIKQ